MDKNKLETRSALAPTTRREMLAYAQILVFVLLVVGVAVTLLQFFFLQPEWIDFGSMSDVTPDQPVPHTTILRDGSTLHVWVVYVQDQWFIFDGYTPVANGNTPVRTECLYQWQPVSGRFEDPCSGMKFSLTGEFVDPYHGFAGKSVQNLNQYVVSIRDGHVLIDANRVIRSEPFTAPGLFAELH